jgi:hypothetical protein
MLTPVSDDLDDQRDDDSSFSENVIQLLLPHIESMLPFLADH